MAAQQSKLAYITGSSRGIGKALAELLLQENYEVIGLSRTNKIEQDNYSFIPIDLSDIDSVKKFEFSQSADEIVLINNAGSLGEISPIGEVTDESITKAMLINAVSPQLLMNKFLATYSNHKGRHHIINISSGAGKRPIPSWATYCASKAAIDLFSETVAEELKWEEKENWFIHSCAPGVVDTEMQNEIRSTPENKFRDVQRFKALKENKELSSPQEVANKLLQLIKNPSNFPDVLISVRDF